ncbi:MAG: DNA mismatch endonuclease (patch repair protein) [Brevundimonas sp.]|jgi:DNA mismatch endonuclease (patch repair protein)|uniref:very short patch repair endonuclease n=1 Tax=Brevundimonas sp. TaxID=1871086 RepID=UPI0039E3515F
MTDGGTARRRATRPDPHSPEQRSRNMARIRGKDTKPELLLRRALHALGLRYRLHDRRLPGAPDLVFSRRRAVVFVHGCFWHAHSCPRGVTPGSNVAFWTDKIEGNAARDQRTEAALRQAGWRVLVVWECALTGRQRRGADETAAEVAAWLEGDDPVGEISGRWPADQAN